MRAMRIEAWGGPDVLRLLPMVLRAPGPGEARVRVLATGVNPLDTKIRAGVTPWLNLAPPVTSGCEGVGMIEALGPGCEGWTEGQRVWSLASSRLGWCATHAIVPVAEIGAVPDAMADDAAAALPVAYLTAVQALDDMGVGEGTRLLVQGGAGAVGSIAVQLARRRGAEVYATASAENLDYLRALGAERAIDYTCERFEDYVPSLDAVFCAVGGEVQRRSMRCLRAGGQLISIESRPDADLGTELGIKAALHSVQSNGRMLNELGVLATEGWLKPRLGAVLPLEEAPRAHAMVESGRTKGKVVLMVGEASR